MKKTLVLLAHPNINNTSQANKEILSHINILEGVDVRNLLQLYPEYKIDVKAEQEALMSHDNIVLMFPFYWYSSPAILKAYMDDVLTYGFAYGEGGDKLKAKHCIISTTTGGPADSYDEMGRNSFDMHTFLTPFQQTAALTGMVYHEPIISHAMIESPGYCEKEELLERSSFHGDCLAKWIKDYS